MAANSLRTRPGKMWARLISQKSTAARLTEVYRGSKDRNDPVRIDQDTKLILFRDCHRGDSSWADDFAPNQLLYFHV